MKIQIRKINLSLTITNEKFTIIIIVRAIFKKKTNIFEVRGPIESFILFAQFVLGKPAFTKEWLPRMVAFKI